ncbi:nuclease-related domain-containing protein [Clostridium beijerinckii]|uniref:nuclease-related domain-containing protein n=1 Tax=Clostridium beijerinckii TaxID=1520 RepID=UPI00080A35C2|nr:nuclease-related domain-containing protein [Clostridium beijerinckii]OCA98716.1 NERD nuclease [Clostridium beijerinckii]
MIGLYIIIILVIIIVLTLKKSKYDKSNYKKESGNGFFAVMMDKGKYGEYLSLNILEKIKGEHRILTNVYLPKENGETTEIDLIYLHETGIYVLESKNYSGWIFGDEKSKYWMQTLKNGQKEKFYNPIKQNNTHIKYLIKLLKVDEKLVKSIIVFSERCIIKKMEVHSENVKVINRYTLNKTIEKLISNSPKVFAAGEIIELYYELKSYICVSKDVKENHIKQIEEKQNLKCNSMNSGLIKENIKSKNIDREIINNVEEIKLVEKEINNESEMEEKQDKVTIDINRNYVSIGNLVTRKIREKLDESGGHASIKLFRGDSCEISYDSNKNGLVSPKIPVPDQLTWESFNAAVEVVINNGGKAPKGSARSKGARLGNDKLPMNSVEGYVAHKVHGVKEGQSAFGPGFVIYAILDWAGICNNEKGFLTIKPSFLMELEESRIEKKSI